MGEKQQNHRSPLVLWPDPNDDGQVMKEANMFDLNMKPHRIHEHTPNNQVRNYILGKGMLHKYGMFQIFAYIFTYLIFPYKLNLVTFVFKYLLFPFFLI